METRPIRAPEAETFLRLLCDVFELDFNRAHRIFFSEPLFDLNRKWALFEGGEMISILTNVPLDFGWGKAIGIAGVATARDKQNQGHAGRLLSAVMDAAAAEGETGTLLFARNPTLYRKLGFEVVDTVVRGPIEVTPEVGPFEILEFQDVQARYDHWALQDPNRLRRDDKRWGYWRWNLRVCTALEDGYMCVEAGVVRECVASRPADEWPLPQGSEWRGLTSMAKQIEIPLLSTEPDLHLMSRQVPGIPQMFMTDQF
jgi:GNAT superfamily N-acetyltransferase